MRLSFFDLNGNRILMDVYRGGIIDKTVMYEAVSRTHWHDITLWV
jgi:hypothetical protein